MLWALEIAGEISSHGQLGFNPTVGRAADKDNDDEKQDDAEISPGLETRVRLSKGSPSSSVRDCDNMDLFEASLEGEAGKPKCFPL